MGDPSPITVTDELLVQVRDELRLLRAELRKTSKSARPAPAAKKPSKQIPVDGR